MYPIMHFMCFLLVTSIDGRRKKYCQFVLFIANTPEIKKKKITKSEKRECLYTLY